MAMNHDGHVLDALRGFFIKKNAIDWIEKEKGGTREYDVGLWYFTGGAYYIKEITIY